MKLTGELNENERSTPDFQSLKSETVRMEKNKDEAKLNDELLDRVNGGTELNAPICPLCYCEAVNNICENLQCSNYGSYIISFA